MKIKTENGEYNVTGQGQGSLNTVLGAVGTAGALGMFNNGLGGIFGGNRPPMSDGDRPVTRYEMDLIRESIAKDSEIAQLKAQQYTNERVNDAERRQCEVNTQQAVYNGVNSATIQCIKNEIAQLLGMTKMVIPNGNIAPGWGSVVVEPVIAPATQATAGSNNG